MIGVLIILEERAREYMIFNIKRKYLFDYKLVKHDTNNDYIDRKGLFKRKTGIVIKKEDIIWTDFKCSCNMNPIFGEVIHVTQTLYFYIDPYLKIALYR